MDIPPDIRPDLAERFRQLRPFDAAELSFVQGVVRRPNRLSRRHEVIIRMALNLARLWILRGSGGDVVVGPRLGAFRDSLHPLAARLQHDRLVDPQALCSDAEQLRPLLIQTKDKLLSELIGQLAREDLERELRHKALVLAMGGGGGCGFVHLGVFNLLQELGLQPKLLAGTSIGSVVGMFRARDHDFSDDTVSAVTDGLSFKKMFALLDSETHYAMPGALRLHLRSALSTFFVNEQGRTRRLDELAIPFLVQVTGVRRDAASGAARYERIFRKELRRGAVGRLLHVRDMVGHGVKLITELASSPGALQPITLGSDALTAGFDTLDAAGFSAALPALIQYDITRNDPRMRDLIETVLRTNGVGFLADGGLTANVPARSAWEYVQAGGIGTRNACIVGLDCFAPTLGRHLLFLPLQRIAAENVARNRPFAQVMFTYRRTLSPTALVPTRRAIDNAMRYGRREFARVAPMLRKFMEPLTEEPFAAS